MNARMSREMESMMDFMQTQISRAINSAISERIIPEIQNMMGSSTLVQQGIGPSSSLNEDEIGNMWKNTKLTKKDSRSACDLRDHTDTIPYRYLQLSEADSIYPNYISVQTSFSTSFPIRIQTFPNRLRMPTTRKQKSKARKSEEAEMLSDLENIDIRLGRNHIQRQDNEFGNLARRPESPTYDVLVYHNNNSHSNSGENEIRRLTGNGHNSGEIDSSGEINRLSGELNRRITQR